MPRLSIFSFDTLDRFRLFPAGFIVGIVILLAIEILVARSDWIVERFPASNLGVISALESEVISGAKPEIVCLGNSRLRDAIAPRLLERDLNLPEGAVLNLAVTGGRPFDSLILYRRNRETLKHAKVLVVDFEYAFYGASQGLNSRVGRYATLQDRIRLFRGHRDLVPSLIGYYWQTYGMRDYLQALIVKPEQSNSMVLADDGRIVWRDEEEDRKIDFQTDNKKVAKGYTAQRIYDQSERELRRLISLAHSDGIVVVLLHVPLRDGFVDYLQAKQQGAYSRLRSEFLNGEFGADLILDWERGADIGVADADFYDYGHVKDSGCRQITKSVGEYLHDRIKLWE